MKHAIAAIGHTALRVRDLDRAIRVATRVMGLRETARVDGWVYLSHDASHHSLQLRGAPTDGFDHLGLVAADGDSLTSLRARLEATGARIVNDRPLDAGIEEGFAFVVPDGFVFEVYRGMARTDAPVSLQGVRPNRFGHVTLNTPEPRQLSDFLQQTLDFRLSDAVPIGYFLRCNADHHGIGVLRGPAPKLHHYAWEVQSIADLARLGDVLDEEGLRMDVGPVRHGAGQNIASYFVDPAGVVVEYYTDMLRVYDEASFVLPEWDPESDRWRSLWTTAFPDDFRDHGAAPVPPADVAAAATAV